ncbi:MAG: phage N-6-adenine-methyltransferase [Gammaproteobacteria bacterium HGW-Gammaproteobacteria-15]|nr:MAG: phage N-6-adenine-methyltransferase [Gammaproteobacteria bacterium HGW-Gammaproteobacteria-15]
MNHYTQALAELKAKPAHKLSEVGDQWQTPPALFWGINAVFGPFIIDLFTDADNSKCPRFYTAENNALVQDWTADLAGGKAFANPPYSRSAYDDDKQAITGMRNIMAKVMAEREKGARIVMLLKSATSEVWWPEEADHIAFVRGRISFDLPQWFIPASDKDKASSAGFAVAICVFDKEWRGQPMQYIERDTLLAQANAIISMIEQRASELAQHYVSATLEHRVDNAHPGEPLSNACKLPEAELSTDALQLPCIAESGEIKAQTELNTESEQQPEPELPLQIPVVEFTSEQIADQLASGKISFDGDHLALMLQLDGMFGKCDIYSTKQIKAAILAHDEPALVTKNESQQEQAQEPEQPTAVAEKVKDTDLNGRSLNPADHYGLLGIPEEMQSMEGKRAAGQWYMGCSSLWILKTEHRDQNRPIIEMPAKMVAKKCQYYPLLDAYAPIENRGAKRVLIGQYTNWDEATAAIAKYISENEKAESPEAEPAHKWPVEVTQIVHCAITAEQYQQVYTTELFERLCESANKMILAPGSTTLAVSQHVKALINDHREAGAAA